jgi:3-hydroxybutyryl-CoA dehydratase
MKRSMVKDDKFNHSFIISPSIYMGFIELFKDNNPLHTDKAFAVEKGFKERVMHGNILNGFISYFVGELLPIKNVIIQTQEIKYHRPVYLNDELLFEAIIANIYESVNTIEFKYNFINSNAIKVASGKITIGII